MPSWTKSRRRAVAVAVAVLGAAGMVLSACGGGRGASEKVVPVEEQLGFEKEGILQRQATVERLIRDCMKAEGFDYTPVDPAARDAALTGGALTEEEFERQFGYGITTLYEPRRAQAAGGPNERTRAALAPADRAAYDRSLLGETGSDTYAVALDNGDFSNLGGCTRKATEEAFGGPGLAETVQSKLDDLDDRIVESPRMQAAIKKWSGCMRAAGYDLTDPQEVDATLKQKLDQIVGPFEQASGSGTAAPPTYDQAALAALQREEVVLVTADLSCEKRYISDVEEKVREELERQFRQENAGLLGQVPAP